MPPPPRMSPAKEMESAEKGKAYAARRRLEWIDAVGAPRYRIRKPMDDVQIGHRDARAWGTTDGEIVLLPFAREDKSRSDHWFVSLSDRAGRSGGAIVLCEERERDPQNFCGRA